MAHIPVLLKEVTEHLNIGKNFKMIDGTAGSGGHIKEVMRINPKAKILGIDLDQSSLTKLKDELSQRGLGQNVKLVQGSYAKMLEIAQANKFLPVDAILLDIGFSSEQVDDPGRGFSFQSSQALDMRFDVKQTLTAADVLNKYSEQQLVAIFKKYGEEVFANKIAHNLVRKRQVSPITLTDQVLVTVVESLPKPVRHKAQDAARRIFQAIRIEVNGELENLKAALPQALELLNPGGRLLVISFHSLEDRIVKKFFVEQAAGCVCPPEFPTCICTKSSRLKIITRKPLMATVEEQEKNPRSKPAKLRVAEKIK